MEPSQPKQPQPAASIPPQPAPMGRPYKKYLLIVLAIIILAATASGAFWKFHHKNKVAIVNSTKSSSKITQSQGSVASNLLGLQLDEKKNYGNKYADGILPVGDERYVTDSAKQGYVFACSQYAHNLATNQGGAMVRGPWFTNNNTEYNLNQKLHVQGSVTWQAQFSNTLSGNTRTIITNDLPNHATGVFPISSADPAYAYDRNPNHIEGQTMTYSLNGDPNYSGPTCESGQVGIMLTGVALFNALDAGGRDAGAWEVQDSCEGHPQSEGIYHYHTLSSCIKNTSVHTVIGFALDGYPITGPQVGTNNVLSTADLDECHGITSQIVLDGKTTTMYHYVMTQDFPYSVSCFRSAPITPPGQPSH